MPEIQERDSHRRPPRLAPGARVAVISPASPVIESSDLQRGLAAMRALELEPVLAPAVGEVRGYLAGDDARRAADLVWALSDDAIDAVWCARGGYGSQRTVAALPGGALDAIAACPARPFVGYSDITVLHALIGRRLGWITFYGPVVVSLGHATDYTLARLRDALFTGEPFEVTAPPEDPWMTTLVPGVAEGELAGGCLALLAALAGTPLQVDFADRICFFEDVHESDDRVDRYLSQMLAAGCFDGCRGIAIGELTDSEKPQYGFEHVFADLLAPLQVPCCYHLPVGHGTHKATLPIGARVRLDADAGTLAVLDPPVL